MDNHHTSSSRPLILFAEDDVDFFIITKYALEQAGFWGMLKLVKSTKELMKYLQDGDIPHLIILDLNSSPNEWREALKALKRDKRYGSVPVAVLTFPIDHKDIAFCQDHNGCSCFERPSDFDEWRTCMEVILRTNLQPSSL